MSLPRSSVTSKAGLRLRMGLATSVVCLTPVLIAQPSASSILRSSVSSGSGQLSNHNLAQVFGEVRSAAGAVQMGATVLLFNRYDQQVRKALSNRDGRFAFDGLTPDIYSLRVSLASFVPALRRNFAVLAGTENLLTINLTTLFSNVELKTASLGDGRLITDDWKWVLRSSGATRPSLRLTSPSTSVTAPWFTDMTGVVRVSATPVGGSSRAGSSPGLPEPLGTAFAVESSMYNGAKVRVSGALGYNAINGLPSSAVRATYLAQREGRSGPQMSLTARQAYFPVGMGVQGTNGSPALRTAAVSVSDSITLLDLFKIEYGASAESIALFGRINYVSPFARLTYNLDGRGVLKLAYSSGSRPNELISGRNPAAGTDNAPAAIDQDLAMLATSPRITRRDNRATVERAKVLELAYEYSAGSRTYATSAFAEEVSNAAFLMSGNTDLAGEANLLPDLNSRGTIFNLGSYRSHGVSASVKQDLGQHLDLSIAVGRAGSLIADGAMLETLGSGDSIRSHIREAQRVWATAGLAGQIRSTGTHLAASYGWTDFRVLMPAHMSLTGQPNQQVGWNASFCQPLPRIGNMRMELSAELQNLLAQGYLTVGSSTGQNAVLTNTPRAFRSGFSFIF
ncbi:MAG: TonB-dependent receptor [Acidobacteriota bacterium]